MNSTPASITNTTIDSNSAQVGCGCSYCQNGHDHDGLSSDVTTPLKDLAVLTGGGGTVTPANIGVNNAAELIHGNEWGPGGGTAANVSYSFVTEVPSYYAVDAREQNNFEAFTTTMQIATRAALDSISEFANITFTEVTGVGDITFGQANLTVSAQDDPTAWAYYPDQGDFSGDVWFNINDNLTNSMDAGELGYFVTLHELGHSLGLIHSFDAGLTGNENTEQFTVMAYNTSPWGNIFAESYMLYDISAIQAIYGANTAFNSDDTTYTLDPNAALSIWDGGGTDTFDASAVSTGVIIHLEEGGYSSVGLSENIAIAYGAVIENAIGGSGNDALHGNDADNVLTGGSGDDQITGGGGQDEAIYSGAFSNYNLTGNLGFFTIEDTTGVDGTDILVDVERFTFSDGYYESGVFTESDTPPDPSSVIDFSTSAFISYNGSQDAGGSITVIESGAGVQLSGNTWKRTAFDYDVTENTVITFEYRSTIQGEVQGFGLETDNNFLTGANSYQLYGADSPNFFIRDFTYTDIGNWQSFTIDVGSYQTGNVDWLAFVNDHDNGAKNGISSYRNISVYEDPTASTDPVAIDDFFVGVENTSITGNVLEDNGNGVDYDPDGDTLSVEGDQIRTDHGIVSLTSFGFFQYTPFTDYVGPDSFSYTLRDGNGGTDIGHVSINIQSEDQAGQSIIDFSTTPFLSYNGSQDAGGSINVIESGAGIEIVGNAWKRTALDYAITQNTFVTFEYRSTVEGEVQGFGLETDNNFTTGADSFQLYGVDSPNFFNRDFQYTDVGNWQSFTIDIGSYQTGHADWLTFINDHDNGLQNGVSTYRNFSIYEGTSPNDVVPDITPLTFDITDFSSFHNQDTNPTSTSAAGTRVELDGNNWKRTAFEYEVTDHSVMSFDFQSDTQGEIQGIGFDDDNDITTDRVIQLYGTQNWGQNGPDYTGDGSPRSFEIDLSDFYAVGTTYSHLTFVSDDDKNSASNSVFDNISIYELGTQSDDFIIGTAQSQALVGLEGEDTIMAGDGDDFLYGGSDMDDLYGEGGADTFIFEAMPNHGEADNIHDFSLADGDRIDISDLLTSYDPLTEAITDFVKIGDDGTHSVLLIDEDGNADNFVPIIVIVGQTGLTDEEALETSGNLITF